MNIPDQAKTISRLKARIARRYQTITQPVALDGGRFSFTRIADPNRVLDEVAAEEDRLEKVNGRRKDGDYLHLPYWAELWDSAYGIGQLLMQQFAEPPVNVLDLGCGMGFAGMVAASLGHNVCLADLESDALLFALVNALPHSHRVRARRLDWRQDHLDEKFELILGADILYERRQWDFLEPFWREHMATNGRVLLGEPGRKTGDDFPAWIEPRGWKIVEHKYATSARKMIRIFEVSLV